MRRRGRRVHIPAVHLPAAALARLIYYLRRRRRRRPPAGIDLCPLKSTSYKLSLHLRRAGEIRRLRAGALCFFPARRPRRIAYKSTREFLLPIELRKVGLGRKRVLHFLSRAQAIGRTRARTRFI